MSYGCLFTDCHGGDGLHLPALIVFIINVIYCLDKTRQFDLSHFKLFANKSIPTEVLCFVNLGASYYFEVGDHTITIPVTCPIPVCPVGCAVHHSAYIPFTCMYAPYVHGKMVAYQNVTPVYYMLLHRMCKITKGHTSFTVYRSK